MKELVENGKILKGYRIKRGFTQYDVADFLGIPKTSYSNAEQGIKKLDIQYILELVDLFDISQADKNILVKNFELYENSKRTKVTISVREYEKMKTDIEHYKQLYKNEKKRVEKIKKTIDKI